MADMKVLWHKIDEAEGRAGKDWHQVELFATDAMHALETDGIDGYHWKAEKPEEQPQPAVEVEEGHHEEDEQ